MRVADDVRLVPLLLRPEEVATVLRVGRTRVYEWMRSGDLRSVKIGHLRRVSATAVAEYVARLDAA
jgi:excisionase family DNA binding protein